MISRNRLLKLIDKPLRGEEQMIALYAGHCVLFLDLLEPNRARYEESRDALMALRDDSRRHRDELTELRDAVLAGSNRDAY